MKLWGNSMPHNFIYHINKPNYAINIRSIE